VTSEEPGGEMMEIMKNQVSRSGIKTHIESFMNGTKLSEFLEIRFQ
jgi:hypothetical protein